MVASYNNCFGRQHAFESVAILHTIANAVWQALSNNKIRNLPHLGKGRSDFKSFDDVLVHAAGADTQVSRFARVPTRSLRLVGHGSAAARYAVNEMYEKVNCKIDVLDWRLGMKFGHMLLPCIAAEVSSSENKGITRLCLPFIQSSEARDIEEAITSLCSLAWFLAFILDRSLVATARLCRIPHKTQIKKEDDDMWFNKSCKSARIATAIKENRKICSTCTSAEVL